MLKKYQVVFSPTALKSYEAIKDKKLLAGIDRTLDDIADNPYAFPKLSGQLKGYRKAKTFSYRIIFEIVENLIEVYVLQIGPRSDVYR